MTIRAVTYYEAWCDTCGERAELGEFQAMGDAQYVADSIQDNDGFVTDDQRVFCQWDCIPDDFCREHDDNIHVFTDGECDCGKSAAAPPVGAVLDPVEPGTE